MQIVSDSFKKAIKSDNRRIYGYVDVKYQNNIYNTEVETIPNVLSVVPNDGSGLLQGNKIMKKYATLENNYTLLDGSFQVWNENIIEDNGFISEDVFEDINDNTITIQNNSTTIPVKGVTIYFKDNLPFDFSVTFTDTDNNSIIDNVVDNSSMVYQYIFEDERNLSEISFNISSVEFADNRIRIAYVDFNISDLYDGDELVDFDVTEELDLLMENLPINTCSIHINNYPDSHGGNKFDPINPVGITKYLTDDVTLEPYIGVLTQENGIEYVKMGVFYLKDWSSNNDGNVRFSGESVLSKLKAKEMIWNNNMFSATVTTPVLANMINNTTGITCLFPQYSMPLDNWSNIHTKLFDYLTYISPCLLFNNQPNPLTTKEYRKFYVNRHNNLVINELSEQVVDTIDRRFLMKDVEYVTNLPIKNVSVDYTLTSSSVATTTETILNIPYTLTKKEEYVWFVVDKYIVNINNIQASVSSGNATLTYIGNNMKLIQVKITGSVGSVINITCTATVATSFYSNRYNSSLVDNTIDTGSTITINFGDCEIPNVDSLTNVFFVLDKPYKISAETMGDPSLEIGDTVSIQTRYNNMYKDMIITKQTFTFDGSLNCRLEGVGD